MKSKIDTISIVLLLLFTAFIYTVNAQNIEILSKDNTFTYDHYHIWPSNDPKASPDIDFFTRNNSIVTIRIDNVSATTVGVQITIQYQNGTQTIESMIYDMMTGQNKPPNIVFGDSTVGGTDLIQKPQEKVDYTETRIYGKISRKVNVFSNVENGWTMIDKTIYNVTNVQKRCYDTQTGMFLESESESFVFNTINPNFNQTIHYFFVLKDTNVWVASKPPSNPESPSILFFPLIIIAVIIVIVVAVLIYFKKHKFNKT